MKMDVAVCFLLGVFFSVQGFTVNFSTYGQSSLYSNSTGPRKAVDENVLTSSITNIGLNEFWWGKFDGPHKISSMFVVVGKGKQRIFVSYGMTDRPSHMCVETVTPPGYDFINMNVTCKQTLEGDTVTVRRVGNGSLVLNEIIPIGKSRMFKECPENTHSFSCISCPPNCINGCSAVDGTCKNDCKKGKFGRMCHRDCHHVCSDGTCDRDEGRCSQENVIIAVVFSLCLVFIVVSVIGFLIKRRKKLFKLFKAPLQPLHLETGNDVIMTYSTSNRYQEGTADPQMPTSPLSNCPVEYIHMIDGQFTVKMSPVEFLRYIDQKQNEELLLKSLVSLPGWLMGRCFEAERAENRAKNRSSTLLPYDRNRFVLEPLENGDDRGDYINASYISGHQNERAYILTLGPFSNDTQLDFWRMVWQSHCKCVVMLTALREGDKKKCMQYWPEESGECGPFFIIIRHTEQFNNYVVRQMIIRKKEETRRLVHFQMTSWGDAKRHMKIDTLLQLRTSVNSITFGDTAPIIIHSGPGISRIGTYISLDILLRQGSGDNIIDIIDTVVKLRSQRAYILNARKEHQFLLRALKVGFSPNQDGAAEETKDDESEEDLYVNAKGKGDIYVNY